MEKAFQVFQYTKKKFPMLFLFNFVPQQILNFLFVSLCEINWIKIQTISLVLNLYILAEILCVLFTLMPSFASDCKKSSSSFNFFFSCANEIKTCGTCFANFI